MRKRFAAAMIAVLPATGMVAGCAGANGGGSNTGATAVPAGAVEIRSAPATGPGIVMFSAPAPLAATVRCTTGNWLYVTVTGAPYPGVSGYVTTGSVGAAGSAPVCDPAILARYPQLPGRLTLHQGTGGGNTFRYAVEMRNFAPDTTYTVSCYEEGDDTAFVTFTARTDPDGNAFRDDGCFSLGGARHWVRIGPYRSQIVEWRTAASATPSRAPATRATSPPATPATATTPALPPYRPPTTGKPLRPTGPVTPPPPILGDPDDGERTRDRTPAARRQKPVTGRPATGWPEPASP